jgi:hypothetical protein
MKTAVEVACSSRPKLKLEMTAASYAVVSRLDANSRWRAARLGAVERAVWAPTEDAVSKASSVTESSLLVLP